MKMKRIFGILLTLTMILGLMPGMSLTALAWDGDPYATLLNTTTVVNFDGKEWYLIENNSTAANAGTVTLLSKECVAASMYASSDKNVATVDRKGKIKAVGAGTCNIWVYAQNGRSKKLTVTVK